MNQAYPVEVLLRLDAQLGHHVWLESGRVRRMAILKGNFRGQMLVEEIVVSRCLSPHPVPLRLASQLPDPNVGEAQARWPRHLGQRFLLLLLEPHIELLVLLLGEGRGIDVMARLCTGRAGASGGIWEIQDVDGAGVGVLVRREALAGRGTPFVLGVHGQADVGAMGAEHRLHEGAQVVMHGEMFLTGDGGVAAHDHVGRGEGTSSRIIQVL
ncbi:hypothetical protein Mapa_008171 [Marchantia paleacea]|nr:hypothetical protein Mapa_008171 [Marchantia paleacea]